MKKDSMKGGYRKMSANYDKDIEGAKMARNSQYKDTDPMVEKEGYLGMDDLDRMRRRKVR